MTTTLLAAPVGADASTSIARSAIDLRPSPVLLAAVHDGAASADETASLVPAHDQMVADGLFHVLVPTELGGGGATIVDWFDAAYELAQVDASAGWLMAQGAAQTAWIAVGGSDDLVAEFFTTRQTLASTSATAVAAERVGDRYRLRNARWPYASGSSGAAFLGGLVASRDADGTPETRMAVVRAADATIEPTWNTTGLRGTASHHIDFGDEVEVPASFTFTWPQLTVRRPGPLAAATRSIGWMISASAAVTSLGAAQHSIRAVADAAADKKHRFDTVPVAHQAPYLRSIAELHGTIDLAVAGLRALLDDLWKGAVAGISPSPETRARLRLAAAHAAMSGADVVRTAHGLLGADALHRSNVLERLGRDGQMLLHHVSISPSTREQLARVLHGTYQGPPGLI
jgi:alkylation response protein AidB-like acyl-CoA dehydrogenase